MTIKNREINISTVLVTNLQTSLRNSQSFLQISFSVPGSYPEPHIAFASNLSQFLSLSFVPYDWLFSKIVIQ